ncbi:nuclear transport factor 2 family protein [Amycolatopsis ultiminotia]|uniref:Nuclear transport factor 2 family protein n=1 Tax=Amycolatopsis ultiminotia TaxID=543629 RepID=A0ABP6Y0U2_9PSEU
MPSPSAVFEYLSEGITAGRFAELAALYAEDTVVEHPQATPRPTRIVGRRAIDERFRGTLAGTLRLEAKNVVVHETTDPEVIVAEYDYVITSPETGKSADAANIQVLRIRDGLIVRSRDYHDYLRMAAVRDSLDDLRKAYEQSPPHVLSSPGERPPSAPAESRQAAFENLVYGVSDGHWDDLPHLYAETTHVTHPFLPGSPVLGNRTDLSTHFAAGKSGVVDIEARDLVTHQSTDPEVLIGEFTYEGRSGSSNPIRANNIFAMRVRDGLIVESRDYGDHLSMAAATGRLPELTARVTTD